MKRLKGLNNYWVSIWDKYYKATQRDFLFFWIGFFHEGVRFVYAQLTYGWPIKQWAIITGIIMILISFWLFYKRIKRRNTNVEFNDKNIDYKTINLKFKNKEETASYNDIEKIQVKKPWVRGIFILVFLLVCMIANCHNSIEILKDTYVDWILFIIISAILLIWRSFYCYILIKFKNTSDYSSCTIRSIGKDVINQLSEIKTLKDKNIF